MGGIHRIKKKMSQPVAMIDTGTGFNDCRIFLAHPNPTVVKKAVAQFGGFMRFTAGRARLLNIGDLYTAHFKILERMGKGEDLIEGDKDD